MIRILNFSCVALMGLMILALYHVSGETRTTRLEFSQVEQKIADERSQLSVLQAQWEQVASPDRIQRLAAAAGMDDTATAQLSSLTLLPRRDDENAPLGGARAASAQASAPMRSPIIKISVRSGM